MTNKTFKEWAQSQGRVWSVWTAYQAAEAAWQAASALSESAGAIELLTALEKIAELGRAKAAAGELSVCERTMREIAVAALKRGCR